MCVRVHVCAGVRPCLYVCVCRCPYVSVRVYVRVRACVRTYVSEGSCKGRDEGRVHVHTETGVPGVTRVQGVVFTCGSTHL